MQFFYDLFIIKVESGVNPYTFFLINHKDNIYET